jgi:hypothetical protein
MRRQVNQCRLSSLLAATAAVLLCGGFSLTFAQAGVGEKYGARDPRRCPAAKQPVRGAPSPAQAAQYLICGDEKEFANDLILLDDVKVEVGGARPFNPVVDRGVQNLDPKQPVYPIRGSFKSYQCSHLVHKADGSIDQNSVGRNCSVYDYANAEGFCFKTTFGDWRCGMMTGQQNRLVEQNVAPPGGAKAAPTPAKKDNTASRDDNAAPKPEQKPAANTEKDGDEKPGANYPKPDFSEMEEWYDVVRYEYDPVEHMLNFWIKPKVENRPHNFSMQFFDKDGVLVDPYDPRWGFGVSLDYVVAVGQVQKASVYMPREKAMQRVVSAKLVKMPNQ